MTEIILKTKDPGKAHRPALGFKEHRHSSDGKIYEVALPDIFDLVDEILSHL